MNKPLLLPEPQRTRTYFIVADSSAFNRIAANFTILDLVITTPQRLQKNGKISR